MVVEPLTRSGRRLVDEAQGGGVVLVAAVDPEGVGLFVEGDGVLGQGPALGDHDAVDGVADLAPDQMAGEGADPLDHPPGPVRDELRPAGLGRIGLVGPHQLEVHRAVGVGADHEAVAPVLEVIEHPRLPRLDQPGRGRGVRAGDQPGLAGLVVAGPDEDPSAGRRAVHVQEEAVVGLLVDQDVVLGAAPGGTAEHLGGPPFGVAPDPEQPVGVLRPAEGAGGLLDRLGQHLSAGQGLHMDAVDLRALLVGGIGVEAVVGAVLGRPEVEVGLAAGEGVGVDQHLLLGGRRAEAAGVDRVLGPGLVADVVFELSVGRGDGGVVGLDAALHLLEQLRLQGLGPGQHGPGVGVLRLQVAADVGAEGLGIVQHLAPVLVLHPGVVVGADAAQLFDALRLARGDRRRRDGSAHGAVLSRTRSRFNSQPLGACARTGQVTATFVRSLPPMRPTAAMRAPRGR